MLHHAHHRFPLHASRFSRSFRRRRLSLPFFAFKNTPHHHHHHHHHHHRVFTPTPTKSREKKNARTGTKSATRCAMVASKKTTLPLPRRRQPPRRAALTSSSGERPKRKRVTTFKSSSSSSSAADFTTKNGELPDETRKKRRFGPRKVLREDQNATEEKVRFLSPKPRTPRKKKDAFDLSRDDFDGGNNCPPKERMMMMMMMFYVERARTPP